MNFNAFARLLALLGFSLPLLAGCTESSNSFGDAGTRGMTPGKFTALAQPSATAGNSAEKIFSKGQPGSVPGSTQDYKIGVLDKLDISVLGVADLTRTVQVTEGGTITLPLVRTVMAKGRTPAEMERELTSKLSKTYLQDPQVTVAIKEYNSQRFTVDGAVNRPGIFPLLGQTTLSQAVAQAQGLTAVSEPSSVFIFRTIEAKRYTARFDLRQVRAGKLTDPILQSGDIVLVDENSAKSNLREFASLTSTVASGSFALIPKPF